MPRPDGLKRLPDSVAEALGWTISLCRFASFTCTLVVGAPTN